ncbi:hypothetical protein [Methanohalobium sp.]|uniref:hypothetical protein n=1 Tax=Methanohalobium sp. TaxID=2837493 RepID=UPI0025E62B35|nr:hypothetical protein [Methanohalobium sp.]
MPSTATSHIKVNPVNNPDGAVILIIDGLSLSYIYPEMTPENIDGVETRKPVLKNWLCRNPIETAINQQILTN